MLCALSAKSTSSRPALSSGTHMPVICNVYYLLPARCVCPASCSLLRLLDATLLRILLTRPR
eukprot:3776206-Pleurochrysis_carterae.AAC.2